MSELTLPSRYKIVAATAGSVTTNGGVTFDNVCLKNVNKAYIVAVFLQAATHATVIQPVVAATDTTGTAITFAANWWKNVDISASDALAVQTAATTATCTLGVVNQILVVEIDPRDVAGQSNTYDWLGATIATSGEPTNFVTGLYFLDMRYPQTTPPTVIA